MNYMREQHRRAQQMRLASIEQWKEKWESTEPHMRIYLGKCPEPIEDLPSEEWYANKATENAQEAREAIYGFKRREAQAEAVRADVERRMASGELVPFHYSQPAKAPISKSWLGRKRREKEAGQN